MPKPGAVSSLIATVLVFMAGSAAASEMPVLGGRAVLGKNSDVIEFKLGGALYDQGIFSPHEVDGYVVNGEVLLPTYDALAFIGSPRVYFGGSYAFVEDGAEAANFVYAGLNWQLHWTETFYTSASIGGSLNDADLALLSLGCNVLFHLAISAGFDITEHVSIEAYADHFSNANLCKQNGGKESAGMRIGLKF